MEPRIETITPRKLIGKRMRMSLADNKTRELWSSFMPRRKEIINMLGTDLYSVQVYDRVPDYSKFDPNDPFYKWAAAEVSDYESLPEGMDTLELPGGDYAVFLHKGAASTGPQTFQYIFGTWLPVSGYLLDNRPHFEVLGDLYRNDHPDSEEEIWIPVKPGKV
jgi:AraC family transcriptional regulator